MNIKTIFNRNKAKGLKPVEYYVYIPENNQKTYIKTNVKILPEQWNFNKNKIKDSHPMAFILNTLLKSVYDKIIDYFEMCYIEGLEPNINALKDYVKGNDMMDFISFIEKELQKEQLSKNSIKNVKQVINKLKYCFGTVQFKDINYEMVITFDKYISDHLSHNTVILYHSLVNKYITRLINMGISKTLKLNPYNKFAKQSKTNKLLFLLEEEVTRLENLQLEGMQQTVRDMFLLSCYTALRYSDIVTLEQANIYDRDKITYLTKEVIKLRHIGIKVTLPISLLFNGKPLKLINKNFNLSNAKVNSCLKIIIDKAGINKDVRFHTARHTFGTIMANKLNGDIFKLGKLMGISNKKTLDVYVHTTNQVIVETLKEIKW